MAKRILNTKNYRLFHNNSGDNRPPDLTKHRKLKESMEKYGFLEEYPIIVYRNDEDQLIVKEGQHRLLFAESLGLTVYYVETKTDFDVAEINGTAQNWSVGDYVTKFAFNGSKHYQDALEFSEHYNLPLSTALSLLAGTTTYTNISEQVRGGSFKIKDRPWADMVAGIYVPLISMSPAIKKNARLLEACMAVCRVEDFDPRRLLNGAERCREKLLSYSTRDAYLDMLEDLYNFGRSKLVGLKAAAMMAMRDRSPVRSRNLSK